MKPELRFSIGNKERVKIKFSWAHILTKYGGKVEPFGYLSLGVGLDIKRKSASLSPLLAALIR